MTIVNSSRNGCVDVFKAFLVEDAEFHGSLDIPVIEPEENIPNRLISFSKSISSKDYGQWVHFFEDDVKFERFWNNPNRYLSILKKYEGVISPDYSMYRDMPLVMQYWNLYRSRALGHWLQSNGVRVIPNIRFGDDRTVEASCLGISKHSIIAFGSYGNLRASNDFTIFSKGATKAISILEPSAIVVYGSAPDSIFGDIKQQGVKVVSFSSEFAAAHNKGAA